MAYNKQVLDDMAKVVGEGFVSADPEDTIAYHKSAPGIPELIGGVIPEYIVLPGSTEEVQEIVRLANKHKVPFYPYCFGTWFFASYKGGIVVDLRRLNKIINIDEDNMTAMVEAGVPYGQLIKEARKRGLDSN